MLGRSRDANGLESLADFKRFPTWMWRNRDVLDFVTWLRAHNESQSGDAAAAGFYGLDLYSLHASMGAVLEYLDRIDPESAQRARSRYACFDHYGEDTQRYGYAAGFGLAKTCEDDVIAQLQDLHRRAENYLHRDGFVAEDEFFFAEQNARLVKNAERYYRSMFQDRVSSWNLRDQSTYRGTVTAASDWDGPMERKAVQPALADSYEALFHEVGIPRFLLTLNDDSVADPLREQRLERAIGVIYLPKTERLSHYFYASLPAQFDAVLHFDETHALEPLAPPSNWPAGDGPDTFPSGM